MDGSTSPQKKLHAPASPASTTARSTTSSSNTSPPPLPSPPAPLPDTSNTLGTSSLAAAADPATTATTSAQDYYNQHSSLLQDEGPAHQWSPQSASSSLSPHGDSSRAPQHQDHHTPQQHKRRQDQSLQEANLLATSSIKRKRPSVAIDPQLQVTPNIPLSASNGHQQQDQLPRQQQQHQQQQSHQHQQQQQQQGPKKQRRVKAPKGRSNSMAESVEQDNGDMSADRPRLTEQEKKNNHIASEQKRRLAIREGFDRLTEIVPGLEGQGRSESIVLKKSVDHMREVLQERQELIEHIQALGGDIPPDLR